MALRFERVYIRDLQKSETDFRDLSAKVVSEIITELYGSRSTQELETVTFRLEWGGEYLDFRVGGPDLLLPDEGSSQLLQNTEFVKIHTSKTFVELAKKASRMLVFEGAKKADICTLKFFDTVKVISSKAYLQMLLDLEKLGKVRLFKSTNILSISGQRFRFTDPTPIAQYGPGLYEVDSLGTNLFSHLSQAVEDMWRLETQVKDAENES